MNYLPCGKRSGRREERVREHHWR